MKAFAYSLTASLLLWTTALSAQPKLEIIGGDTYDWGTISDVSKPLTGQVELKNVGDKELVIYSTRPACGCTSDALDQTNLKPGETTRLRFSVNVGSASGQIIKSITVTTNAQPDSIKVLFLKANILRLVQADQFVSLYPMYVGREVSGTVKVRNNSSAPVKLLEFTGNNGLTVPKKPPVTVPAHSEIDLPIKAVGPQQPGSFYGQLLIKTDSQDPQYKLLEVRIYAENKPASEAPSPAMLPSAGINK
ncbi:MAG: DUF1573 domain-containing protein [Bacteroidota bacterium]|nr:DUF1573 domain-containing protein [Candidatus Kapabacteria bacterium]MDW8220826.1 DUF1573 domain-containing protein [Bacteroidota bacterium]